VRNWCGGRRIRIQVVRRLHYAAALTCGVFAALVVHILLTVFGVGLDTVLRQLAKGSRPQFVSALAWWAIAAVRERDFVYLIARPFLIAVVFALVTAGGVMSKQQSRRHRRCDRWPHRARAGLRLRLLRRAADLCERRAGLSDCSVARV
jgi:hypothetical protein